jgi:SPP1 gp7 family putative phage head morphogenesis protein
VTKRPMGSKVLKAHVQDLGAAAKRAIEGNIRLGMMAGESVPKLKARILRDVSGKIDGPIPQQVRRQAEAIARTIPNYIGNAARQETMRANADVLKGWRWDSTLDARSCPFCASRDGREYGVDAGTAPPPAHPQCRCQMGFVVSGEARKAAGWKPVDRSKFTRPSEGGPVKHGTKFEAWLGTQPDKFVDRWMGKERASLWRGGVSLERLVDKKTLDFKPLVTARRVAARVGA